MNTSQTPEEKIDHSYKIHTEMEGSPLRISLISLS